MASAGAPGDARRQGGPADRAENPGRALAALRREYAGDTLTPDDLHRDPLVGFRAWMDDAIASGCAEPNAMTLATVDPSGAPSARVVLLKDVDSGFVFYTNLRSHKGRDLAGDPRAAVVFNWLDLHRQVRAQGRCIALSDERSDAYWDTRPIGSRLSAAASPQSTVIDDLSALHDTIAHLAEAHPDGGVPRPRHWRGVRLVPHTIEFWQGRPDRLHQRFRYARDGDHDEWTIDQLAP